MAQLFEQLNPEQKQAVTHRDGPLLIIAGAGTGKTSVITRRIAYLIEQKLAQPHEILALTFTDKAAGEMEERVDLLLPPGYYDYWISTFHAFCQRILEQHALDIGLSNSFRLLDEIQQWIFVKQNFERFSLQYYKPLGSPNRHIDSLLDHFSKCKDELITPEAYLQYARSLPKEDEASAQEAQRLFELGEAYSTYQQLLLDHEYLDFGDLINYTIRLFRDRPQILKHYQNQFKYILIDEFQDTNYAQYELIKLLSGQVTTKPSGKGKRSRVVYPNNLVVVGDDDQSIYKFRGASVSNILKFEQDFPQAKQITLVQNYRSAQGILDLAYDFIQLNNPDRLEVKLGIDKQLKANNKDTAHIEVLEADDMASELNLVVRKIIELKQRHPESSWNHFAILIRANAAAEEILTRLDQANITYTFLANKGLYRKPLIADLINYLKLLDNHHESSALYRVFTLPRFKLSPFVLAAMSNFAKRKAISLYEALHRTSEIPEVTPDSQAIVESLTHLIEQHSGLLTEKSATELFVQIVHDLGVVADLVEDSIANLENRELLDQFYKKIEAFAESSTDRSLHAFMQELELEFQAGHKGQIKFDPNKGPESLKVMTVHSAKGLEFPYVFVVGMVDQRFPTRAQRDAIPVPEPLINELLPEGDAHLQEERRLFYVAMTRAKTHLYFSWGKDYGGAKTKKPSVFLQETGLVPGEHVSQATGKVVFTKLTSPADIEVYQHLPTDFSFSDISSFEHCPLEYKFRNYLKLPMPGAPQLSFGSTIHSVLQQISKFYISHHQSQTRVPGNDVILQWYQEQWLDDWYHDKAEKEQYRAEGIEMIYRVVEDLRTQRPIIKYIEEPFTIALGDYRLKGRFDRVDDFGDGRLVVIDYKTNNAPRQRQKKDADQLRIYQLALADAYQAEVAGMYYWHLRDNTKAEQAPATPEELETLRASLLNSIEIIRHTIKFDKFRELHDSAKMHDCRYENLL